MLEEYFIPTPPSLIFTLLKAMQSKTHEETQLAIQDIQEADYSDYSCNAITLEGSGPTSQFRHTLKVHHEERVLSTIEVDTEVNGGVTRLVFNLQAAYCSSLGELAYSLRDILEAFGSNLPEEVEITGSTEFNAWVNAGTPDHCVGTYSAAKSANCPAMSFKVFVHNYPEGGWLVNLDWTMVNEPLAQ